MPSFASSDNPCLAHGDGSRTTANDVQVEPRGILYLAKDPRVCDLVGALSCVVARRRRDAIWDGKNDGGLTSQMAVPYTSTLSQHAVAIVDSVASILRPTTILNEGFALPGLLGPYE